jgi:hypothetical protein
MMLTVVLPIDNVRGMPGAQLNVAVGHFLVSTQLREVGGQYSIALLMALMYRGFELLQPESYDVKKGSTFLSVVIFDLQALPAPEALQSLKSR